MCMFLVYFILSRVSRHVLTSAIGHTSLSGKCSPQIRYAYRYILKHSSEAEPSADLREALLKTRYIVSLIKFEQTGSSQYICNLLLKFLSFLKRSVGYVWFDYYTTFT